MNKAKFLINSLTATFLGILGVSTLVVPQSAIAITLGFENSFDEWDTSGTTSIKDDRFGGITPTEGTRQAFLSTEGTNPTHPTPVFQPFFPPFLTGDSLEGQGIREGFLFSDSQITDFGKTLSPTTAYTQGSAIKTKISISVNAGDTLKFDYNFLTDENSSLRISGNDLAFFSLDDQLFPLAIFSEVESSLVDSDTLFSKETSYQEYSYTFSRAGNFILGFGVVDGNDSAGDSGLLVDNIRLESEPDVASVPEPSSIFGIFLLGVWLGIKRQLG